MTGPVSGRSGLGPASGASPGAPGKRGDRRGPLRVLLEVPRRALALLVRGYQVGVSPYTPPACRYDPVCSQYGMDALRVHGAVKGTILTTGRILRCNPLSHGGPDPVPAPGMWRNPRRLRHPAH